MYRYMVRGHRERKLYALELYVQELDMETAPSIENNMVRIFLLTILVV